MYFKYASSMLQISAIRTSIGTYGLFSKLTKKGHGWSVGYEYAMDVFVVRQLDSPPAHIFRQYRSLKMDISSTLISMVNDHIEKASYRIKIIDFKSQGDL